MNFKRTENNTINEMCIYIANYTQHNTEQRKSINTDFFKSHCNNYCIVI